MKRIGITGGIATGKSTVTNYLREKGFIVIDADEGARKVVEKNTKGLQKLVEHFGSSILTEEGTLNRQQLGQVIFNDKTKRQQLNAILHPFIFEWIEKELSVVQESMVFIDIPLLYEVGYQKNVDEVWLICATDEVQLQRLMERNHLGKEEAKNRIKAQWPLEEKRKQADIVIENNGSIIQLMNQIDTLLNIKN